MSCYSTFVTMLTEDARMRRARIESSVVRDRRTVARLSSWTLRRLCRSGGAERARTDRPPACKASALPTELQPRDGQIALTSLATGGPGQS